MLKTKAMKHLKNASNKNWNPTHNCVSWPLTPPLSIFTYIIDYFYSLRFVLLTSFQIELPLLLLGGVVY